MPGNSEHELPLPWGPFLDELDEAISEPIALYCIGGFVVSLLYGLPRPTGDVDYIAVIPRYRMDELEQPILLYPSSSGTARRTKVMLNSWQKRCRLTQNSCRIDMTASCARI